MTRFLGYVSKQCHVSHLLTDVRMDGDQGATGETPVDFVSHALCFILFTFFFQFRVYARMSCRRALMFVLGGGMERIYQDQRSNQRK